MIDNWREENLEWSSLNWVTTMARANAVSISSQHQVEATYDKEELKFNDITLNKKIGTI